ncbi:synapse differentiation-inducing gene protein 1 [Trichomycterus rosablanca]|uniref:synapse differentiation-inducing gene protein 1 n=1 Tax=Trichomycterus rosablanca TaxID=2290929 RepID=UPI002F359000
MDSLDELEHPLLADSPTQSTGNGLINPTIVRYEESKRPPCTAWRKHPASTDVHHQQLLDPCSLPSTLESFYAPPASIWGPGESLGIHSKEYLETTFMDIGPGSPLERKLMAVSRDVHTVSYSMEDEDDLLPDFEDSSSDDFTDTESENNFPLMIPQDHLGLAFFSMLCCFWPLGIAAFYLSQKTNKAWAQGDFQAANRASRHTLWLSIISIIFGIVTYICAVTALINYLSGKPP